MPGPRASVLVCVCACACGMFDLGVNENMICRCRNNNAPRKRHTTDKHRRRFDRIPLTGPNNTRDPHPNTATTLPGTAGPSIDRMHASLSARSLRASLLPGRGRRSALSSLIGDDQVGYEGGLESPSRHAQPNPTAAVRHGCGGKKASNHMQAWLYVRSCRATTDRCRAF